MNESAARRNAAGGSGTVGTTPLPHPFETHPEGNLKRRTIHVTPSARMRGSSAARGFVSLHRDAKTRRGYSDKDREERWNDDFQDRNELRSAIVKCPCQFAGHQKSDQC